MTYFDSTLEAPPITEQNTDPILPEERHVFELVGFERSEPDQWRKDGGIKWSWRVFEEDGRTPFVFQEEQYIFFRTTGIDKQGRPTFSVGTYANEWASALLGRPLGVNDHFQISELRGKRFSAMVVWEKQRSDPTKKTIKLASLRHVPVGAAPATNGRTAKPSDPERQSRDQVSADPSDAEVDRALLMTGLKKSVERLRKLDADSGAKAAQALADSDADAPLADLERLHEQVKAAIQKALDD